MALYNITITDPADMESAQALKRLNSAPLEQIEHGQVVSNDDVLEYIKKLKGVAHPCADSSANH